MSVKARVLHLVVTEFCDNVIESAVSVFTSFPPNV